MVKVYMQHPWRVSDSNYYKQILEHPPQGIDYVNKIKRVGNITNKGEFKFNNFLKQKLKSVIKVLLPNLPNAHLTRTRENYDLIHCAHCMSKNNSPWVADIEYARQFWVVAKGMRKKDQVKKILMSKYCKKIMAWTEWGKKEILDIFPELKNKIDVVTYAFPPQVRKKRGEEINLTFISRRFLFKGGLHALEVIDRLTKKFDNVHGTFVSDVPKNILKKYSSNKKIEFLDLLPYEKIVKEIFPRTDIFVYPSYTDTFGFLMVESLAFGVPVVTVDGQSRRELIQDEKTGFVIDPIKNLNFNVLKGQEEMISKIESRVKRLILDDSLREKMSKNAFKEVKEGKFSLQERNKKLKEIYLEALR